MVKRTNSAIKEYRTQDGSKRFKFQTYIGKDPVTGKDKRVTRQGFKSYTEANRMFEKLRSDHDTRSFESITLNRLEEMWWQSYLPTVRESTAKKFEEFYRRNLKENLGNLKIREIEPATWQEFANKLAKKYVNYKRWLNYMKRIYNYAIALKLTDENPFNNIVVPKRTSRPRRDISTNFYEQDELEDFLLTAQDVSFEVYIYFYLLAGSGMRKGEALALHWDDIDLKEGLIHIHRTLTLDLDNNVFEQETTKSKAGVRTVPIPDKLVKEIKKYKLQSNSSNLLFSTASGDVLTLSKPQQWLKSVYDRNDDLRQITIHGFRHTYASLVFSTNSEIKPTDMRDLLGHETVEMSLNIYTHVNDESKKRIKDTIKKLTI